MVRPLVVALALLVSGIPAIAGDDDVSRAGGIEQSPVTLGLATEHESVRPGSKTVVAVRFTMAPGWHVYWENAGDAGLPPTITFDLPDGYEIGPVRFPTPQRIPVAHLVTIGYEGDVLLSAVVSVPKDAPAGDVEMGAKVTWLACNEEQCIDGNGRVTASFTVGATTLPRATEKEALTRHRAALPLPLPKPAAARRVDDTLVLDLVVAGLTVPEGAVTDFFPADESWVTYARPTLAADRRSLVLKLRKRHRDTELTGLLTITHDGTTIAYRVKVAVTTDDEGHER